MIYESLITKFCKWCWYQHRIRKYEYFLGKYLIIFVLSLSLSLSLSFFLFDMGWKTFEFDEISATKGEFLPHYNHNRWCTVCNGLCQKSVRRYIWEKNWRIYVETRSEFLSTCQIDTVNLGIIEYYWQHQKAQKWKWIMLEIMSKN